MELHPQTQMSLWFCFVFLFWSKWCHSHDISNFCWDGQISSLLLLSFRSQWCEGDGRTLYLGQPGKCQSCHSFLSAGLVQLPIFLRDEGLRWQVHYLETSSWQASLSLNTAFCTLCYSHSFAINVPLSRVLKTGSIYVKKRRFISTHTPEVFMEQQTLSLSLWAHLNGQWVSIQDPVENRISSNYIQTDLLPQGSFI